MPRSKNASRKKKPKQQATKGGTAQHSNDGDTKQTYSTNQLMTKAEECMDSFEPEAACMFVQRALEQDSQNSELMERAGPVLLEAGQPDTAKTVLSRAASLTPDSVSHVTYMYLGQLSGEAEAVTYFRRGIERVQSQLQAQSAEAGAGDGARAKLVEALCRAHCAVAEAYMTDLCFEEDAQNQCDSALRSALEADPNNSETLQLLASFKLTCGEREAAIVALRRSVEPWLPPLGQAQAANDTESAKRPEFEARVRAAQLAIELEEYQLASQVLEQLLDEDDGIVQVWYLLGWLNYLQKLVANAVHYLSQAIQLEDKADADDQQLLQHARELLEELKSDDPDSAEAETVSIAEAAATADLDIVSSDEEDMET